MRKTIYVALLGGILLPLLISGCAATRQIPPFQPLDMTPGLAEGRIVPKVGGFLLVLDASASMSQRYRGIPRIDEAVSVLDHLNRTLPELDVSAGLRVFGDTAGPFGLFSRRVYGMTPYRRDDLDKAITGAAQAGGNSPLGEALSGAEDDLATVSGNMALILVSDGDVLRQSAVAAAQRMKTRFGDRLCIHTVQIGDSHRGGALLRQIAAAGGCGLTATAGDLFHPADMADYVTAVFFDVIHDRDRDGVPDADDRCPESPAGKAVAWTGCPPDGDGDGVPDDVDRCPGTPAKAVVDAAGCRPDSDGDGVTDDLDQCPDTPRGADTDQRGCWVLSDVQFGVAESAIRPEFARRLDAVVAVLQANPGVHVEIQGHTDNTGPAAVNRALSEARARAVVAYLSAQGVDAGRLTHRGLGATRPVAVNDMPEGRALNRRVEIRPLP